MLTSYAMTTASMIISQATTFPTGPHGLFQKYAIQSITLNAVELKSSEDTNSHLAISFAQMGPAVEGIFRSLNNLLEKFNRSYWFYLLASTRRYISIGYYLIPFAFFASPLIFQALHIYSSLNSGFNDDQSKNKVSLWSTISFAFITHVFGLCLACFPYLLQHYASLQLDYALKTKDVLYFSLLTFSIILMFNPLISVSKKRAEQKNAHKCIALLNLSLLLGCLSLLNFSLAISLTVIYVPIVSLVNSNFDTVLSKVRKVTSYLCLTLLHPLAFSYLCLLGLSFYSDSRSGIFHHFFRTFYAHKKILFFFVNDWYLYGNWTYFFASTFLFPVWLQIWCLL